MYPEIDLYKHYLENLITREYSEELPDVTKKSTLEKINYAINLAPQWNVCMDIGGSSGNYLAALAKKFKKTILVEMEHLPEQDLHKKKHNNFVVEITRIEEYQTNEKADFILLADVFEHIPDIKNFAHKLSTLQNIDGIVYIMTPNPVFCGPASESGLYVKRHPAGHIKQYTKTEIISLMKESGYTLELLSFEETSRRQKIKRIIFAISRRDKKYSKYFIYRIVRPLILITFKLFFKFLEFFTYKKEIENIHNEYTTLTQNLTFRKIA